MKDPSFVLDIRQIKEILPHRYPFLLVDRVISLDLINNEITALKNVTGNENYFQGHFPAVPIMPGVLILEALAQSGGILVHQKGYKEKIALLMNVSNAKFRKPVLPGDVLILHARALHMSNKGGKVKGRATVQDQLVVEAELSFALMNKEKL